MRLFKKNIPVLPKAIKIPSPAELDPTKHELGFEIPLWRWILIAASLRFVATFTQLHYGHPDEWFQTVEFGNFIASGFASFSESFTFHLRNLTWPALLSWVIRLADTLSGHQVFWRLWSIRAFTALLDLSAIWGMVRILRYSKLQPGFRNLMWMLWLVAYFTVQDSVRPSQEHLSTIAMWLSLGAGASGNFWLCGFFGALTGVFRYPSGLFGLGIFFMLILRWPKPKMWLTFILGAVGGLCLGGIADWIYYGRPYESLYQYSQFNVFSGMVNAHYGTQSIVEYFPYFKGHWDKFLLPVGILLALMVPVGLIRGLRHRELWTGALIFYLVGHLWTAHKEPRFMAPIEGLLLWSAVNGMQSMVNFWMGRKWQVPELTGLVRAVAWILVLVNAGYLGRVMWGEAFRPIHTYEEIDRHLKRAPCAVVTVVRPFSVRMPYQSQALVPEPAFAFFPVTPHTALNPQSGDLSSKPLIWIEREPQCTPQSSVLLHLSKPHIYWEKEKNCKILPSGILSWAGVERAKPLTELGWVSSVWYECPASALKAFKKTQVRHVIAREIPSWDELLPINTPADVLEKHGLARQEAGIMDGTLGDF